MHKLVFAMLLLSTSSVDADVAANNSFWNHPTVASCCSQGDAVYAEKYRPLTDGSLEVEVTGRGPRNHDWAPIGRKYIILPDKIKIVLVANPESKPILFLNPRLLEPLCFVLGPEG